LLRTYTLICITWILCTLGKAQDPDVLFAFQIDEKVESIEPLAILKNGRLTQPPLLSYDKEKQKEALRFNAEMFRPGRTYRLFSGGDEIGSVVVLRDETQDYGSSASVMLRGVDHATFHTGIGTNSRLIKGADRHSSSLGNSQKERLRRIATQQFRKRGVPPSALKEMKLTGGFSADFANRRLLIGTYHLDEVSKNDEHHYNLVLACSPNGADPIVIRYSKGGEVDGTYESAFDHIDIDNDGIDEIVTRKTYYEAWGYEVYSFKNGKWTHIYGVLVGGV
jgi:hypothetical protein